jgi:hypothetical protein
MHKEKCKGKCPEPASLEVEHALAGLLDQKGSSDVEGRGRDGIETDSYGWDYFSQLIG